LDRVRLLRATLPQLLFFAFLVTPILWQKEQLKHAIWLGDFNPLNHMIEIVRMPLLDGTMPLTSFVVVLACTAGFVGLAALTHHANREMIVFRWIA
jgi:ABC-type polysaccharide/polyol phosphate export permease